MARCKSNAPFFCPHGLILEGAMDVDKNDLGPQKRLQKMRDLTGRRLQEKKTGPQQQQQRGAHFSRHLSSTLVFLLSVGLMIQYPSLLHQVNDEISQLAMGLFFRQASVGCELQPPDPPISMLAAPARRQKVDDCSCDHFVASRGGPSHAQH